jgi:hypothetical protein
MSFPTLSGIGDSVGLRGNSGQVQTVTLNASAAGSNVIVTGVPAALGVPARIIRVLAYVLVAAGPVAVTWESSGGLVLGGPMAFPGPVSMPVPFNPLGQFSTLPGESLVLFLDSACQVGGHVTFVIAQ